MSNQTGIVLAAAVKLEKQLPLEIATLDGLHKDFEQLMGELEGPDGEPFVIQDREDLEFLGALLKHIKAEAKRIEARRKTVTKPIHDALVAFRSIDKPTLKLLQKLEALIKSKIEEYTLWQLEEQRLQAAELAAAAREKDFSKAMAVSANMVEVHEVKGVTVTEKWDYAVVNKELVPEFLKAVSDDAVKAYIKEHGKEKPKDVSGLRFFRVGSTRAGSK